MSLGRFTHALLFATALTCTGCLSDPDPTEDGPPIGAPERRPVDTLRDRLERALNSADMYGLLDSVDDESLLLVPRHPALSGRAAIRAFCEPLFVHFDVHFETQAEEVIVEPDWAYDIGSFDLDLTPRGTAVGSRTSGHYLNMYHRRESGFWSLSHIVLASGSEFARDLPNSAPLHPPADPPSTGPEEELLAIEAVVDRLLAAQGDQDVEACLAAWHTAGAIYPAGGEPVRGSAELAAYYTERFEIGRNHVSHTADERWTRGQWAYVRGRLDGATELRNGFERPVHHKYVAILHKPRREWKLLRLIWSPSA